MSYLLVVDFRIMRSQRLLHDRMHEPGNIAAETRDLAHQRRRDKTVLLRRRQEKRFRRRNQMPVHARKLEFVFEIRYRAQSAQDHASADFLDEVGQQHSKPAHLDIGQSLQR